MSFRRCLTYSLFSNEGFKFNFSPNVFRKNNRIYLRKFAAQYEPKEPPKTKKAATFYERLGVLPTATQSEIKNAYYDLALKYHPDTSDGAQAEAIFRDVTEAYGVLGNVETRKFYDQEIGSYFMLRGSSKKETIRPVWRLIDERIVNIDARKIKQGKSFICHVASLASILGVPVRVTNVCRNSLIRGIPANEMRALMLLRQICNGTLSGSTGSTTLTFLPSDLQSGRYYIDAYQFGNVSDLIPYAIPSLMFVPDPHIGRSNVLFLSGPTYTYDGLHIDHITKVYQPIMNQFGISFNIEVKKRGYLPYGRGSVVVRSNPVEYINSIKMTDPGVVTRITGRAFVAGDKPIKIAQIMAKKAQVSLKQIFTDIPIMIDSVRESNSRSEGMGQGILIVAETSTSCVFSGSGLWKKGVGTESVVEIAMKELMDNINSGGCVDSWMQDQVIVPMALAKGNSVVKTGPLTSKTKAALRALREITKVRFKIIKEKSTPEINLIKCKGIGYTNLYI
ncbi:RNA 3'-terminal phosphate cyclase-like [Dendronephthya gigantea]|uniref:RNA 3'-terminal phosphate cyclase-like n=1 Tax=Dendronephthya gigantea TaxID=151771 RepID=UPI0010697F23|nr:RNA 3'-terminal phosphate cyclase-like [Dendronephthya gigantea]